MAPRESAARPAPPGQRRTRRQELLEIAADLFAEQGYHGTSIRDIAQRAGIRSGSLYSHIASKEDLLYELTYNVEREVLDRVRAATAAESDPVAKFRVGLRTHFAVTAGYMYMRKVALAEWRALEGDRLAEIVQLRDDYEAVWAAIIQGGIDAGRFAPFDKKLAVLTVLSVANWMYQWYRPTGPLTPEELADAFATQLLDGFSLRPSGA